MRVIRFNFSGLNTDNHEEFKHSFSNRVQEAVRLFLDTYKDIFPSAVVLLNSLNERNPGLGTIDLAYAGVSGTEIKVFVIID